MRTCTCELVTILFKTWQESSWKPRSTIYLESRLTKIGQILGLGRNLISTIYICIGGYLYVLLKRCYQNPITLQINQKRLVIEIKGINDGSKFYWNWWVLLPNSNNKTLFSIGRESIFFVIQGAQKGKFRS